MNWLVVKQAHLHSNYMPTGDRKKNQIHSVAMTLVSKRDGDVENKNPHVTSH